MAIQMADESYARNSWYYAILSAFRDFTERGTDPKKYFLKLLDVNIKSNDFFHNVVNEACSSTSFVNSNVDQLERPNAFLLPQGRCCENILFQTLQHFANNKRNGKKYVLSNGLFDTTNANSTLNAFEGLNFFHENFYDQVEITELGKSNPFRGDINLAKLEDFLTKNSKNVPIIVLTLTNNTGAGQPVSMKCIKEVSKLCLQYEIPL